MLPFSGLKASPSGKVKWSSSLKLCGQMPLPAYTKQMKKNIFKALTVMKAGHQDTRNVHERLVYRYVRLLLSGR